MFEKEFRYTKWNNTYNSVYGYEKAIIFHLKL